MTEVAFFEKKKKNPKFYGFREKNEILNNNHETNNSDNFNM